jgi:hypothetical protein
MSIDGLDEAIVVAVAPEDPCCRPIGQTASQFDVCEDADLSVSGGSGGRTPTARCLRACAHLQDGSK